MPYGEMPKVATRAIGGAWQCGPSCSGPTLEAVRQMVQAGRRMRIQTEHMGSLGQ